MTDHLKELSAQGVSIWLDDLSRPLITGGGLQKLIDTSSVVGVTTNPTIFAGALSKGDAYSDQIRELAAEGKSVSEAAFALITRDVQSACDIMAPIYLASEGEDGRVSIEVDPGLAHDTAGTVEQVMELHAAVDRPNVYIKIPATVEGLPAIAQVLAAGISVNATLIFSLDRYRGVMNAFLTGLEQARLAGLDLAQIHSVASFFVSRVDTEVDKRLDALGIEEAAALLGKAGVANARLAYQAYQEVFATPRWENLAAEGAHRQRPLWASTGVKDPAYRDTMYVVDLAAPETVNTMPTKTLQAVADHAMIAGDQVTGMYDDATNVLDSLERLGISYSEVTGVLETEGVDKFAKSWSELLATVQTELTKGNAVSTVALGVLASGPAADAVTRHVPQLVADGFASRLFAKDPTLWGPEAESESAVRLSWVSLGRTSRPLVGEVAALRDHLAGQGVDHVVLCGMGGSSLAPEVICATAGVGLTVLDSSHPDSVRNALTNRLDRAVVVVSSKSGSTVETDSQRRAFIEAFTRAGIDPTARIVIVTDPGSPLDKDARAAGYRVVNADPNVGGRYSALTAFGLVPSGLAGVDLEQLLDEAESVADLLADDDEANPALRLGAAMAGTEPLRDKLVLVDAGCGLPGFANWAEQLIAESTGKNGTGVLPVVVQGEHDPEVRSPASDITVARLVTDVVDLDEDDADGSKDAEQAHDPSRSEVKVSGSLGAQVLLWEVATAAAGRILGINPFDQPDVESAKKATRGLLDASGTTPDPATFTDGAIEVRALGGDWLGSVTTVAGAVDSLLSQLDRQQGYVSIMAYLDRLADADLAAVRGTVATRTQAPTTFGWGPRFLHSTGQYHKGGPSNGVYLQITAAPHEDLAIPGREFTFGDFITAQAGGDAQVLADRGRPVLRLHLTDHDAGLDQLTRALGLGLA